MSIADDLSETFKVPSIGNNKFPDSLSLLILTQALSLLILTHALSLINSQARFVPEHSAATPISIARRASMPSV
jgi:hypothetical protein